MKKRKNNPSPAEFALAAVARRNGVTVDYVKEQIQIAMSAGMSTNDPQVQAAWSEIPRAGVTPTPEELVTYATHKVRT